jgi:hypothetical protein
MRFGMAFKEKLGGIYSGLNELWPKLAWQAFLPPRSGTYSATMVERSKTLLNLEPPPCGISPRST